MIGPAGAGKSYLCATLAAASDFVLGSRWAVLSMDGYHLPNAQLEATTHTDPRTGAIHSLKAMKGTHVPSIFRVSFPSSLTCGS